MAHQLLRSSDCIATGFCSLQHLLEGRFVKRVQSEKGSSWRFHCGSSAVNLRDDCLMVTVRHLDSFLPTAARGLLMVRLTTLEAETFAVHVFSATVGNMTKIHASKTPHGLDFPPDSANNPSDAYLPSLQELFGLVWWKVRTRCLCTSIRFP
ncbi:hypothetical protein ACLKA6_000848 [Drosophila palustris]